MLGSSVNTLLSDVSRRLAAAGCIFLLLGISVDWWSGAGVGKKG